MATYGSSPEHTEPTEAQALSVSRSEWSNNAFTAFGTPVYDQETKRDKSGKLNSFPNRIVERPSIDTHVAPDVLKDLPGTFMELSSKVHDNLADPRHGGLMAADLKHTYLTIGMHSEDRHYFAFTISGIGQLQPTRMQQGSQSAGFTMTEAVYRAFGALPPPMKEPSLLHSGNPSTLPPLTFYMNDFFGGFQDFEEQYQFLRHHFLPRIE